MSEVTSYRVVLQFDNELVAGCPALPEDAEKRLAKTRAWVTKQLGEEPDEDLIEKAMQDIGIGSGKVFKRHQDRPVIETRQIKAMLREASQRLGLLQGGKEKFGRQHMQHDVEVFGTDHRFYVDLGVDEPQEGERPIHVMTAQGPRSDMSQYEYVDRPEIEFTVKVLNGVAKTVLTEGTLTDILETAGIFMGLGSDRSQGFGRFTVKEVAHV